MSVKKLTFVSLLALVSFALAAQDAPVTTTSTSGQAAGGAYRSFTPPDMWEIGIHAGVPFIVGDLDAKFPGFGGGIHVRKAFDHIFSLRVSGLFAQMENETEGSSPSTSETSWISGSAQMVIALNNFRFNRPYRRILVNGILGLGVNSFKTDYRNVTQTDPQLTSGTIDDNPNVHVDFGGGVAFRFSRRFNLGVEYTLSSVLGSNGDLLDADENVGSSRTTFRDFVHYPHVSLNFNLGGADKSEPLYWVNPLGQVSDAISALEARPIYDPTDTDGDGIIDAIDDEDNSQPGARVDTRGRTLDSDGDKVADYMDKEPFSPPGYSVNSDGVANVPKPITEADVNRIVDAKLANFKVPTGGTIGFMPNVNFALNSYAIPYSQYEQLYQVASLLKSNPSLRIVVTGNADKSGPEQYNQVLSYNRANAVVNFLTTNHGIARDRLILNYAGENNAIIPVNGANMTNRRVEFRQAASEKDQTRPEGPEAGRGDRTNRFQGNKDAGN